MSGGHAFAFSPCICCRRVFAYNPMRVPSSSALTGQREPICEGCLELINLRRKQLGLDPIVPLPGAYEPCPEEELDF